jgi:hypothetical protein
MQNLKAILFPAALFISCICVSTYTCAQVPDWFWAKDARGSKEDYAKSIATDLNGNAFIAGYFLSPTFAIGTDTLINSGSGTAEMFIAKYDPAGNLLWARSAGGSASDEYIGITTDAGGNAYVTGHFQSTSVTFGSTIFNNPYGADLVIVKYNSNGNVVWAKCVAGINTGMAWGNKIHADGNADLLVTGSYSGSHLTFGAITINNNNPGGPPANFTAKYDSAGTAIWVEQVVTNSIGVINAITTDVDDNIYITGEYYATFVTFGPITLGNSDAYDMFIVKYGPGGNVLWAKSAGGNQSDKGEDIIADKCGNVYVTGIFESDSILMGSTTLHCAGLYDMFIVKFDISGNMQWSKSIGGSEVDGGIAVASSEMCNIYVAGVFRSYSLTFGSTLLIRKKSGFYDVFILKYDKDGNEHWALAGGGNSDELLSEIMIDIRGDLYLTGTFEDSAIFGEDTLSSPLFNNVFIAKLDLDETGVGMPHKIISKDLLSVVPNPGSGWFEVQGLKKGEWKIDLHSLCGKCIYQSVISDTKPSLQLPEHVKGFYIFRIFNEREILQAGKIIIQ